VFEMNDISVKTNRLPQGHVSTNGHHPVLKAETLNIGYGQRTVVEGLSLDLLKGGITALVGPNGSGKSTLLKTLARLLKPSAGEVFLNGKSISRMSTSVVAQEIAVLPQGPVAPPGLTVGELVEQGRYPHAGPLKMLRKQDYSAISEALRLTGMEDFTHRSLDNLSGGEKQRAWIALALAQETPVLLLDEPTTFLDIGHQLEVLELVEKLNRDKGMTVVLVVHDLNHAARYATRMVALKDGLIVADGPPSEVLTADLLNFLFGVHAHIISDPETGKPVCLPYAVVATAEKE
jgi:iron complex transport system ATP-binding protein